MKTLQKKVYSSVALYSRYTFLCGLPRYQSISWCLTEILTFGRFRDTVLASGGARHPRDVFQDFRGRPLSSDALLKSYGLQ